MIDDRITRKSRRRDKVGENKVEEKEDKKSLQENREEHSSERRSRI